MKKSKKSSQAPKDPGRPKEFPFTKEERAKWAELLEEDNLLAVERFGFESKLKAHQARRMGFWVKVARRLGVMLEELDQKKLITDTVYLKGKE